MKELNRKILLALALVVSCLTSMVWSQSSNQESVPLQVIAAGSGVNLGITRALAEAFMKSHPEVKIEVPGSIGTRGAIKAVNDGAISIGLISISLDEDQKELGLTVLPYARTAIVVGAHPGVKDEEITFEELVGIYKGTKTSWKDGHDIVVLTRWWWDSGFLLLEKEIPGFKEAVAESREARRWLVSFTDQEANRSLSTVPYSIGVTDTGMIATERLKIKALKINGLAPTLENILSGRYPLVRELSFIYRKTDLSEPARAFLDFVLSDEGAGILKSNGYIPAKYGDQQ